MRIINPKTMVIYPVLFPKREDGRFSLILHVQPSGTSPPWRGGLTQSCYRGNRGGFTLLNSIPKRTRVRRNDSKIAALTPGS
jgi:hypothetical protein